MSLEKMLFSPVHRASRDPWPRAWCAYALTTARSSLRTTRSCFRELILSFANTFRRCHRRGCRLCVAARLARREELVSRSLGIRLVAHLLEHLVSFAQLRSGVNTAILPPQPLAVDEPRAGEHDLIRVFPRRSIASRYELAASSPSASNARDLASPGGDVRLHAYGFRVCGT